MMNEDLQFVLRGKNRTAFIKCLEKGAKILPEIRKATDIHKSHIGRVVKPLEERKLIKCHNSKDSILRIYELTKKGKKILEEVKSLTFD